MFRRTWRSHMTDSERRRGLVFLLLYLFIFPRVSAWAQKLFLSDAETMAAEANIIYYGFLFILVLLVFWGFLRQDFTDLLDWLPENLFGGVAALAAALAGRGLLSLLPLPVSDPTLSQYAAEFAASPVATAVLVILLIPLVEEMAFRGILYGSLRGYSKPIAAVITTLGYAFACVWRYALDLSDPRYLLLTLLYLPISAALTWCYDNGGSIWGTALCHAGINAATLFLAVR